MNSVPDAFIGVEACWPLYSQEPWSHLVSVTPAQLAVHAYAIGASGSGKSVLLHHLMAQDLARGHSICVLDLRGDLVNAVLELCAGRVDPCLVKVIDLREKERPFGFNPLYGAGEPYFRALNVVKVAESESSSWGVQVAQTITNVLLVLAEAGGCLTDLDDFFFNSSFRAQCLKHVDYEPLVDFWRRYDAMPEERQVTFAMPVLNKLSALLATPSLRCILGHQDPIDLGHHLDTKGSVLLVSLAVDETHGSGKMTGSLVMSAICREIFSRVNVPENQRNPVRLYVDEFENFSLHEFDQILAEGRRFKFSIVMAHQTLAQISPRMRSMILGNVGLKFVFRVGYEDGQVLGKDIFGDPKFYNFTELPVGHCVMWRKGLGDMEVEVNEPLLPNVGTLTPAGAAFAKEVYRHAPPFQRRPREKLLDADLIQIAEHQDTQPKRRVPKPQLEDWLCN